MESDSRTGVVYLVGAGPGAADLITVRGLRLLRTADVVLHDSLISPELLTEVRSDAEVVSVGKRGYCIGSTRQETINDALVRFAREGKTVCRLKCGDPCLFGRGGEEAEVLAEAEIPFEIVPGVTSAMAACAAANIPLTHRAVGQSVTFVTGHHDPDSPDCTHDWQALSRLPVVVFYMASRHVAKIAIKLCEQGLSADTPAAVIESATLPTERVVTANLTVIGNGEFASPAVFVVGEVVRYRDILLGLAASHSGSLGMIRPLYRVKPKLVVIGNGMAGARLLEDVLATDPDRFDITVFGDEPYGNYNRILLSNVLNGTQDAKEIFLNPLAWYAENGITLHAGKRVTTIDRDAKTVSAGDLTVPYDYLVFATGSKPFVPPVPGTSLHGVFVFRTLDDCRNIAEYAKGRKSAVVIGGGLLGLEAAKGLMTHDVKVTVVEMAPWLMSVQLDEAGGNVLGQTIEKMGITTLTGASTKELVGHTSVTGVKFADGSVVPADMVVISAGIRPNVDLAKESGITCDRAIVVDDQLRTNDPAVFGVGECVQHNGMIYGLVAPLWEQTRVLAKVLTGVGTVAKYTGSKIATKLKVMGVELASMGRIADLKPTDEVVQFSEPSRQVYWKAIIRDGKVNAACLLGDLGPADDLMRMFQAGTPVPERRLELFFTANSEKKEASLADLPDSHQICDCNGVCKGAIVKAIQAGKCTVPAVGKVTRAGTGCGSCKKLVKGLIEAVAGGVKADPSESWYVTAVPLDKPTLVTVVKERGLKSVSAVLRELGTADDEKSRNGLASMLKGLWGSEYIDERDSRFVNDRVHANIQKDGTFSVIPRVYGGVTTADDLIRIGEVAKKYKVPMIKYTGGQRIDLLGIKKDDLPKVWADLGMPSGYAYTKALRTVKTCVGSEYCRYGTNDSTTLGIALEKRFQGFEFPAKVKLGVSGCPRNCAESTVKDVGVVATEGGEWEVSVGGAARAHVRKSDVLCRVKTQEEALRVIGRFLIYYRDNAKWIERTYDFAPRIGMDKLKDILVNDSLGICSELDAEVEKTIAAYVDPWLERDKPAYVGQFEDVKTVSLPMV